MTFARPCGVAALLFVARAGLAQAPPPAGAAAPASTVAPAVASAAASSAAPTIDKVDPPNWWAGHSINPVRLLVRGRNLAGARLDCPRLACSDVRVNAAGTHVFVDVTVPRGATPGRYPLQLRTASGQAPITFTVSPPLTTAGRYGGFGPDDVCTC
jgi:hypothetical protein